MKNGKHKRSLFVHRRDLRVDDNTALLEAGKNSDCVVSCFIVDPRQVKDNPHRSEAAVRFMRGSLVDLDAEYHSLGSRLHLYSGEAHTVIASLVRDKHIDAVFINRDYTPFSRSRDRDIERVCKDLGVAFYAYDDVLLHAPGAVMKHDGTPYSVFTPYHTRASAQPLREPAAFNGTLASVDGAETIDVLHDWLLLGADYSESLSGGRVKAMEILAGVGDHAAYKDDRDFPARNATTRLSAYIKFGCCSAREVARAIRSALGEGHELLRQLHWRDFFTQVAWFNPRVFAGPFDERYATIEWENDPVLFDAWREGRTGFPIVDAGMRELERTGTMHNRCRMIVSSFLAKDLHIDWRWGERYFATRLVDYDPAVNNGNWQWAASTGCDAQPYFRIFNPWLQQTKFDADAVYIKTWVGELDALTPAQIHNLWKTHPAGVDYPPPIVDHKVRSRRSRDLYEAARGTPSPPPR